MSIKIVLYKAQALDNSAIDPYKLDGVFLNAEATTKRQEAQSYASDISLKGRKIYSVEWVNLFNFKDKFLLEIPCIEKDVAGRIAAVICCGTFESFDDADTKAIVNGLQSFIHDIERSVDEVATQRAMDALEVLKKNSKQTSIKKVLLIVTPILLILVYIAMSNI